MIKYEIPQVMFDIVQTNKDNSDMTFKFSGLIEGMGMALGNFLRIAGMSCSYGYASLAFRMTGIDFDLDISSNYTTPADTISNNIASILIRNSINNGEELPEYFFLGFKNVVSGDIKLKDFQAFTIDRQPLQVEFINPDLTIATTSKELMVEAMILFKLESGALGAEDVIINEPPVQLRSFISDNIILDAWFNSTKVITYEVLKDTPTINLETLLLRIQTDGRITAHELLTFTGNLLMKHLAPLAFLYKVDWGAITLNLENKNAASTPDKDLSSVRVEELNIRPKVYNMLKANKLENLRDLKVYDETSGKEKFSPEIREELIKSLKEIGFTEVIKKE